MDLTYASAFAGIGGFEVGFARSGWRPTVLIEWDKNCQRVLAQHYPTTPLKGDICDVRGTELGRVNLIGGGFPCQDTSIAAPHRTGLAGQRSGHYHEFVRLVEEHLRLVDECQPEWVVIENPEGLLKSNDGRDMATVVGGLEDLGYGWAYRTVDGRHLGTTQRRRRVLVVGHLGGGPGPAGDVLGLTGAGASPATAHPVRGRQGRPALAGVPRGGPVVWRKSARARAALSKGGYETWVQAQDGNTLTGFDGGAATRQTHLVAQNGRLRTLTLTEWERLQGFPDGWTAAIPNSARYTALGNAIHTGTAAWLGQNLRAVHTALHG